jgi:hypothetical protein
MQKKPFLRVFYSDTEPKPKIILERCNSCCQHDKQTKTGLYSLAARRLMV